MLRLLVWRSTSTSTYVFVARLLIKIKDTFKLMETRRQILHVCQAKKTPCEVIRIAVTWRNFGIYFESRNAILILSLTNNVNRASSLYLPQLLISSYSPYSLHYYRSMYRSKYFSLPCTQSISTTAPYFTPNITAGFTIVWYFSILTAVFTDMDPNICLRQKKICYLQ